jgi:DNA-binding CsgD family transcriptional regulator
MGGPSTMTEKDLRRLLDVVSPAATSSAGPELPEQVLIGLAELIPCAAIDFFVMDTRRAEIKCAQELVLQDLPTGDDETDALFFDAYWECAACSSPELLGNHSPVITWHDFYSEREFERLKMAEYFRRLGIWHELLVCLPPKGGYERRLMLTRDASDLPFSERDRLLLTLLRPHLANTRDRIEAERRTVPDLTPRQVELLHRVARGDTNRQIGRDLGLSEGTVRKHLENIYRRLEVRSRTEAVTVVGPHLAS